jgi:hypothetical protein
MRSDIVQGIISGEIAGIQITQETLVASAVLMIIPILMILLSLSLPKKANRVTNIILGIVYFVINLATMLTTGGAWAYYYIFAVAEVVLSILIVVYSLRWKIKCSSHFHFLFSITRRCLKKKQKSEIAICRVVRKLD